MNKSSLSDETPKDIAAELLRTREQLRALARLASIVLGKREILGEPFGLDERNLRAQIEFALNERTETNLPTTIDLNGHVDQKGVQYIGKAYRQEDGAYRCLGRIGNVLCTVEVKITAQPKTMCPTCGHEYTGPLPDDSPYMRLKKAASDAVKYMGTATHSMRSLSDLLLELNKP
jgi:hypothetical protein